MTRPLDDLHPLERELVILIDETAALLSADAKGLDSWRPILRAHGIEGEPAEAFIRAVNTACRTIAQSERRHFRDPVNVANQVFLTLLHGIRLGRKGLA